MNQEQEAAKAAWLAHEIERLPGMTPEELHLVSCWYDRQLDAQFQRFETLEAMQRHDAEVDERLRRAAEELGLTDAPRQKTPAPTR